MPHFGIPRSPCPFSPVRNRPAYGVCLFPAGVVQMNVGIMLSFLNQRYFRDRLSMWCEFVPQMVFLNGLFGYLCLLIIGKWISGSTADIYHILIYMFLSPGESGLTCNGECMENHMYPGQGVIQVGNHIPA